MEISHFDKNGPPYIFSIEFQGENTQGLTC